MELHIGVWDLVVIYALPLVAAGTVIIIGLTLLYLAVVLPWPRFDFKFDLLVLFEDQKSRRRFRGKSLAFLRFYLKSMCGDSGAQALFFYRLSRFFLLHRLGILADMLQRLSKFLTQVDISPHAIIGHGLFIYHGSGVVIGKNSRLGSRCTICQGVTTGQGAPQVGNNVKLWAGAKILGNITIGDNCEVGANAVLLESLEPNTIAVGVPATRKIAKSTIHE